MEWVKSHPYATAGIVFGVGLLVILLFFTGGSSAAPDNTAAALAAAQAQEAASGNSLQQTQAELAAASNATTAGVVAGGQDDAAAVSIAQIQANSATNAATIAANAASETAQYNAQAGIVTSTVGAQANEYASLQATIQKYYDDISSSNVTMQKNTLDFLAGETGPAGPNVLNQGYLSYTPNGVVFGTQSSTAGNAPWGGVAFPEEVTATLPSTTLPPIFTQPSPPQPSDIPTSTGIH